MITLSVNIDHVATLRQARGENKPDPVAAAILCEKAGAHGITFHLREDRRHIQDSDVDRIKDIIKVKRNMEMACTKEMISIAEKTFPHQVTFVPEKRQELTTEGGLDVQANFQIIKEAVDRLQKQDIQVSLFIDPNEDQIQKAVDTGAEAIELHTGEYANAKTEAETKEELQKLKHAANYAHSKGLIVYAGHGIDYKNIPGILEIPYVEELNIGHSIISRSVFVGIQSAVEEMLEAMKIRQPT